MPGFAGDDIDDSGRVDTFSIYLDSHRSAIYFGLSLLQQFDRQTQPLVGVEHRPQRVGEVRQIGVEVQRLVQRLGDGVETAR